MKITFYLLKSSTAADHCTSRNVVDVRVCGCAVDCEISRVFRFSRADDLKIKRKNLREKLKREGEKFVKQTSGQCVVITSIHHNA